MVKILYISIVLIVVSLVTKAQNLDLCYHPKPGTIYMMEHVTNQVIDMTFPKDSTSNEKESVSLKMNITYRYKMKVLDINKNGDIRFEIYYDYFDIGGGAEEEYFQYSSTTPIDQVDEKNKEKFENLKSIIGVHYTITMTKYGKVTTVIGYDNVVKTMYKEDINKPNQFGYVPSLSEEDFKNMMNESFYIFSESKKMELGSTWSTKSNQTLLFGDVSTLNTYTLVKNTDTRSNIKSTTANSSVAKSPVKMTLHGDGEIFFNKEEGMFSQIEYTLSMKGSIDVMGISMDMNSNGIVRVNIYHDSEF